MSAMVILNEVDVNIKSFSRFYTMQLVCLWQASSLCSPESGRYTRYGEIDDDFVYWFINEDIRGIDRLKKTIVKKYHL